MQIYLITNQDSMGQVKHLSGLTGLIGTLFHQYDIYRDLSGLIGAGMTLVGTHRSRYDTHWNLAGMTLIGTHLGRYDTH